MRGGREGIFCSLYGLVFLSNSSTRSFSCRISSSFSRFTVCLNLNIARFNSTEVSLLCIGKVSDRSSAASCPPRCTNDCCTTLSSSCCGTSVITRASSFSFAYASTMAIVVSTALGLFKIVEHIESFFGESLWNGSRMLLPMELVEFFDQFIFLILR